MLPDGASVTIFRSLFEVLIIVMLHFCETNSLRPPFHVHFFQKVGLLYGGSFISQKFAPGFAHIHLSAVLMWIIQVNAQSHALKT